MLSKLTSTSAPTATLDATFSIFANRIVLLFVSFLPNMYLQPLNARWLAYLRGVLPCRFPPPPSTPQEPGLKILKAGSLWLRALLLRRGATEGPNSSLFICSGLGRVDLPKLWVSG